MNSILDLPEIPIFIIVNYLSAKELVKLSCTCSLFYKYSCNEMLWKELCLNDFPWFVFNNQCERTLLPYIKGQRRTRIKNKDENLYLQGNIPIQEILATTAVMDGDLGVRCPNTHRIIDNPFHPLFENALVSPKVEFMSHELSLPKSKYKSAYYRIVKGEYTGLIQVLNSLVNREMSAFVAIATYDLSTHEFHLSYNPSLISKYRRGEYIVLNKNDGINPIDESISLNQRHRFRRIPIELLEYDPREIYTRELFDNELEQGVPNLEVGDEVEVQWRFHIKDSWAFWRGFVVKIQPGNTHESDERGEGIMVVFPNYPASCEWLLFPYKD